MFLSRKFLDPVIVQGIGLASMGPGCFYPGNVSSLSGDLETLLASMGPGCFYPGNVAPPGEVEPPVAASMGPGCFHPGNLAFLTACPSRAAGLTRGGVFLSRKYW